jgi:hypothetical protein
MRFRSSSIVASFFAVGICSCAFQLKTPPQT